MRPIQRGFEYEVRLCVSIPIAWSTLLKEASKHHYDARSREAGNRGVMFVCEVWQSAYGHRACKRTWLFYKGVPPAQLDWSRPRGTHQVGWFDRVKPTLSKKKASRTPPAFAAALISLAANATPTQQLTKADAL